MVKKGFKGINLTVDRLVPKELIQQLGYKINPSGEVVPDKVLKSTSAEEYHRYQAELFDTFEEMTLFHKDGLDKDGLDIIKPRHAVIDQFLDNINRGESSYFMCSIL